jgi:hypothetical protein
MINLEGSKLKRTELEEGRKVGCIQVSTGEKEYFILAKGERLLTEWIVALEKAAQPRPTSNQLIRTTSKTVHHTSPSLSFSSSSSCCSSSCVRT